MHVNDMNQINLSANCCKSRGE